MERSELTRANIFPTAGQQNWFVHRDNYIPHGGDIPLAEYTYKWSCCGKRQGDDETCK